MNAAEVKRNERIAKMSDRDLLNTVLEAALEDISDAEMAAFADMLAKGQSLSQKQRAWAESAARRVIPVSSGDVPRGRPVETPAVLRNLPKAPPGRTVR